MAWGWAHKFVISSCFHSNQIYISGTKISEGIVLSVLQDLDIGQTFAELHEHMRDTGTTDNHVLILIKSVARSYIKIRMHHLAKEANETRIKDDRIHKKINKTILFKNQWCSKVMLPCQFLHTMHCKSILDRCIAFINLLWFAKGSPSDPPCSVPWTRDLPISRWLL